MAGGGVGLESGACDLLIRELHPAGEIEGGCCDCCSCGGGGGGGGIGKY